MTPNRRRQLSRRQAESLLDGRPVDHLLAGVLGAARRPADPARPAAGEGEALAAFRASAGTHPLRQPLTQSRSSSVPILSVRSAVALKLAAAGAAVVAVGGVAAAATRTDDHPAPSAAASASAVRATPTHAAEHPAVAPTGEPATSGSASPSHPAHPSASGAHGAKAAPGQAVARERRLAAACRIWPQWVDRRVRANDPVHGHAGQPAPAPQPAVVAELVRAAGGASGVASFCVKLVGDTPARANASVPSRTLPPAPAAPGPAARA
jgi:hypothetical protein